MIRNIGSYDDLWKQVRRPGRSMFRALPGRCTACRPTEAKAGEFSVSRGKPRDAEAIAALINHLSRAARDTHR